MDLADSCSSSLAFIPVGTASTFLLWGARGTGGVQKIGRVQWAPFHLILQTFPPLLLCASQVVSEFFTMSGSSRSTTSPISFDIPEPPGCLCRLGPSVNLHRLIYAMSEFSRSVVLRVIHTLVSVIGS